MSEYMDVVKGRVGGRWQDRLSAPSAIPGYITEPESVHSENPHSSLRSLHMRLRWQAAKYSERVLTSTYKWGSNIPGQTSIK